MALAWLNRKLKWLFFIIVIIIIVVLVVRFNRAKTAIIDFIHRDDGLAKAVDALSGKSQDAIVLIPKEVDFSERLAPVKPRRKNKAKQSVNKVEAENNATVDQQTETEPVNDELESEEVPNPGRGNLPRRKNSKTSNYKREEICRKILEDYFDDYFPTCRPRFLTNPKTGYPLELDGYNPRLSLAFETSGEQHYKYPNFFHKTREQFDKQVERDEFKKQRCRELMIDIIEIPYTVPTNQLEAYIHSALKQLGK